MWASPLPLKHVTPALSSPALGTKTGLPLLLGTTATADVATALMIFAPFPPVSSTHSSHPDWWQSLLCNQALPPPPFNELSLPEQRRRMVLGLWSPAGLSNSKTVLPPIG